MYRPCPLCQKTKPGFFFNGPHRDYLRCQRCGLIYVPKDELLPPKAEKSRYDLHENDPTHKGYRRFLQQHIQRLIAQIGPPPQYGLDFGSGPGPVLAQMIEKQGYPMARFDPYYDADSEVLNQTYNFITCTEVFEHFYQPAREWRLLLELLQAGGWLGVMTKLVDQPADFPEMHYISDDTHVSFYSRRTFRFLTRRDSLKAKFFGDNIILIQKPA
mgnify:CR=1 FL=1